MCFLYDLPRFIRTTYFIHCIIDNITMCQWNNYTVFFKCIIHRKIEAIENSK